MRAVVCRKPGELALEERPAPDIPPEGWALIDVGHVGICGTDREEASGGRRGELTCSLLDLVESEVGHVQLLGALLHRSTRVPLATQRHWLPASL